MKVTRAEINKLIRQVRDGKAPKLPKDTFEANYWHPLLDGFGIRLLYTGRASWVQQYKRYGRTQKTTLGDVRVLDEPIALKAARDLMAKIQLGMLDPQAAKAEAKRTAKVTFEAVAEQYRAAPRKTGLRASSARDFKLFFTGYYFQPLHKMPIDEITHEQITLQLQRITQQSGSQTAWKAHALLRALFHWAFKKGLHPGPKGLPMARVEQPQKNAARTRILKPEEIRTIWLTCETWEAEAVAGTRTLSTRGDTTARFGPPSIPDFPRAVMLLFLTGCRAGEIGDLRWDEVNFDKGQIEIPGERTKNKEPLVLPLCDTALNILKRVQRRPGHVFGTKAGKGLSKISQASIAIDKRIATAQGIKTPTQREGGRRRRMGDSHWTVHDIRRTFRSGMGEIGVSSDIGERLLGHVGHRTEVERTYDQHTYGPQMRDAVVRWEAHLLNIVHGTEQKVATLPRRTIGD